MKHTQLNKKINGNHRITSYSLNISLKEAETLGFSDIRQYTYFVNKEIIDGKLVISKAFPQTDEDFRKILNDFGIIGKRLSDKLLLDLLYFIEGDSEAYCKQRSKTYSSIRYLR